MLFGKRHAQAAALEERSNKAFTLDGQMAYKIMQGVPLPSWEKDLWQEVNSQEQVMVVAITSFLVG